jgi:diacylglycerol kinase family enzyme
MSGALTAHSEPAPATGAAPRWLARLAFVAGAAAVVLLLVAAGLRGAIALLLVGTAGVAVTLVGVWWFLSRRGPARWFAAAVALAPLPIVAILYVRAGLLWVVVAFAVLWAVAGIAGRAALTGAARTAGPRLFETPPPRRPFLIMNPRSGGGKVERFDLVRRATDLGAEVVLLTEGGPGDVTVLARQAVADGADLLGVAGGDGTQALVAAVAAETGTPFMVISAGTRNHFAMDLGLDRVDPSTCLDALTDGVELRVDLGRIGDRTFVNNASFGAYASVVQSPAYRADKAATTLELLPDLLARHRGPGLRLRTDDVVATGSQAVLVSNNPYATDDVAGLGHRDRLDTGLLGVLAVTVGGAADAARLVRGRRSKVVTMITANEVTIEADAQSIPVGIDGEAVLMPTPVRCSIQAGALRVRVPRVRPAARRARAAMDWTRLRQLALSTGHRRP